jgi:hypothetical protein
MLFLVRWVPGRGPEQRESNKTVLGKLQRGGLAPLCEGLAHGGSEGVEQPAVVSSGL